MRMPQRRQRMMQRLMRKLWMTQIPKRKTYQKKRQMQPVRMHRQKRIKNMNLIQKTFRQNLQRVCGIFSPVFRENRMRVILSNRWMMWLPRQKKQLKKFRQKRSRETILMIFCCPWALHRKKRQSQQFWAKRLKQNHSQWKQQNHMWRKSLKLSRKQRLNWLRK